jgi:predicted negative regulator of RcsB-dependent stress response
LHYRATEEDEAEFDDYGARIVTDSSFEWDAEPENDNLFKGDVWFANDNLKEANEKYKKALKTLSAKQKKKSK